MCYLLGYILYTDRSKCDRIFKQFNGHEKEKKNHSREINYNAKEPI